MKKRLFTCALAAAIFSTHVLTSCSEDETNTPTTNTGGTSKYVIAATAGDATYLVTTESLDEGSVSITNNGTETDGGAYWFSMEKTIFSACNITTVLQEQVPPIS